MKKLVSLALVLAIVMSFAVSVSAEENVGTGEYAANVTGSYVAGTTASGTVFSVDIGWTAMSFTYHAEKAPVWDATNHKYSEVTDAYWEGEGTITVTNHSNAKITATPAYTPADGYGNADMTFSVQQLNLASAESGAAQVGTITVTPTGYLPQMNDSATIGSIKVTIAHDNNVSVDEAEALVAKANTLIAEARAAGKYDTYAAQFTSMMQDKNTVQDLIDLYRAVEDGSMQWDDSFTFEEWQELINSEYPKLLGGYNNCLNVTGM